jgi:hypothetical protein
MPRNLPPLSSPASAETIEEHRRIGRRWIIAAQAAHPDLPIEDALVAVQRAAGPLDPSSVARYRGDLRHGLFDAMTAAGRLDELPIAWPKVDAALNSRKARIAKSNKRTSAKKIEDATEDEARALFSELKRHAIAHKNPNAILAALFVLVAGHAGFRPIELRGALVLRTQLTLPNAKKRPGHQLTRTMDLAGLHNDVLIGIELLLSLIDHDITKAAFAKWQKVLAEQLRRACVRISIRVLSLYSFRHVAIATWAAAGLSPKEIADLCGHLSIRTAHTHYARAAAGHKRTAIASAVLPAPTQQLQGGSTDRGPDGVGREAGIGSDQNGETLAPGFSEAMFADMPPPMYRQDTSVTTVSAEQARRYFDNLIGNRDTSEIAEKIRTAMVEDKVQEQAACNKVGSNSDPEF